MNTIQTGKKYLITTSSWFFAPDGQSYTAAFGTVRGVRLAEEVLGVKPNRQSANWYVEIGNLVIAGCQIHFAVRTDTCSNEPWLREEAHEGKVLTTGVQGRIYFADPE